MRKITIIAEVGPNHNGNYKLAKKFVDKISKSGADYIKFQTSIASDHISKFALKAAYQKKNTKKNKESQLEMAKNISLSHKEFDLIFNYCKKKKIKFLTTAFGFKSLKFIRKFNMDYIKVPSGEINNLIYLKNLPINKKTKILLSTGMSKISEIKEAIILLQKFGIPKKKIILLQCTSAYPVPFKDVNLNAMLTLKKKFGVDVGFSDHSKGIEASIAAVALGAQFIEKHVTFNNNLPGPDHRASLNMNQFYTLVKSIRNIEKALGDGIKKIENSEKKNKIVARNSIVAKKEIRKNEKFNINNITIKRPGYGISPMKFGKIVGKKAKKKFKTDEIISL